MMEKRNVVESKRTPDHELDRDDPNWDKAASDVFTVSFADTEILLDGKSKQPSSASSGVVTDVVSK